MWRIRPGQKILHHCWDEECAVYNDLSGDTHLVERSTIELLVSLAERPSLPGALVDQCFGDAAGLDALLRELALLHLIEPVPCSP